MNVAMDLQEPQDVYILRPAGEININSITRLRNELEGCRIDAYERVIVDLGRVDFLDSSGLGWMVVIVKQVRMAGHRIAFCTPNDLVRRLLTTIRIDRYVTIYESLELALRCL